MVKHTLRDIQKKHEAAFEYGVQKGYLSKELRHQQEDNYEKLAKARGMILNQAIELEEFLNFFLAYYFASDARAPKFSIIFSKTSPSEINAITREITNGKVHDKQTFLQQQFAHDGKDLDFSDYFLPHISVNYHGLKPVASRV